MKIGIFGGTFNPIHYGHLRVAEEVRDKVNLDKILFVPAGNPPLKTEDIADTEYRYEMAKLAVADNRFFELSDIECRLTGKSYTVNTIEELRRAHPESEFFLILGIDAFLDMPNWWHPDVLITLTNFIVISRPGVRFADIEKSPYLNVEGVTLREMDNATTEKYISKLKSDRDAIFLTLTQIDISSTEIRSLIKQNKSIKYLLPPEVQSYIIMNGLYKNKS
jgi:nicotinate-nucleotide adenylyltransferase